MLILLAIRGLLHAHDEPSAAPGVLPTRSEYARTFGKFLALTIVNPLTVVYFAAIVLGLGLADDLRAAEAVAFVAGAFLASLSWQTILAATGAVLGRKVPPLVRFAAIVIGNAVVIGFALLIMVR